MSIPRGNRRRRLARSGPIGLRVQTGIASAVDDVFLWIPPEGIIAWQVQVNPTELTIRNVE
jgi:hypothetical protein